MNEHTMKHIRDKVRMVEGDEPSFDVLSTGEQIAVALVLDRADLVRESWGSILEACERLGPDWQESALRVQRERR